MSIVFCINFIYKLYANILKSMMPMTIKMLIDKVIALLVEPQPKLSEGGADILETTNLANN